MSKLFRTLCPLVALCFAGTAVAAEFQLPRWVRVMKCTVFPFREYNAYKKEEAGKTLWSVNKTQWDNVEDLEPVHWDTRNVRLNNGCTDKSCTFFGNFEAGGTFELTRLRTSTGGLLMMVSDSNEPNRRVHCDESKP